MQKSLLNSKLTPPKSSRHTVDRTEICKRVFEASECRVVLIRAPAGFGKTTVMAQLCERYTREGTAVAWLTLDEADNDLPRFLSYLLIFLKKHLQPGLSLEELSAEMTHDAGYVTALLAAQFKEHDRRLILFLDELDVIRDSAVLAVVKQLTIRMPSNARLILGSRTVPEIGLGRLRARGELFEVLSEQLRFSEADAQDFLIKSRGLGLAPAQLQKLVRSTEGWATALGLASIALERSHNSDTLIAGFSGPASAVAEYLAQDVMAGQTAQVRDFLLKASVLPQFDASLCNAVCSRSDSAELLDRLERDSLFISVVNQQEGLFRFHSLFRAFLHAQLLKHHAALLPQLHRSAAEWFLKEGRPIPAIDHALKTHDLNFAMPLLETHAESLLNQGRVRLLARWLETFPEAVQNSPRLRLLHIWAVNLTRGPEEALAMLEEIDADSLGGGAALAQYNAMQPTLLAMRDRIDDSFALGLERIKSIKPEYGFPYVILSQTLAVDSMVLGEYTEAHRYVDQAHAAHRGRASALHIGLTASINGAIDLIQGRLKQALAELRLAAGISGDDFFKSGNRNLLSGVLLAEALYETGDIERAEGFLDLFLPLAQMLGLPDQLMVAHFLSARIVERHHDPDRSLELLTELESTGHRLRIPRIVASARVEKSAALLLRGDTHAAREQLQRADESMNWAQVSRRSFIANDKVTLAIGRTRWMVRSGEAGAAVPLLKKQLAAAVAAHRHRRALKLRILLAEALEASGQHNRAMRTLSLAAEAGLPEGFVSIFVEEGERVQDMLRTLLSNRRNEPWFEPGDRLSAYVSKMITTRDTEAPVSTMTDIPDESITRKELQILKLLGEGISNDAIGERLHISESTVRSHLRSINTKLRARNRLHALAVARQRQLIS